MRILYAGHTFTIRANQAKLASLASISGNEILLITPDHWKGPLYTNKADLYDLKPTLEHRRLRSKFVGKESAFFYRDDLDGILKRFRPDIIHVEEGAYAVSYAQILHSAMRSAPEARAVFFTWWNLAYRLSGIKAFLERYNLQHSSGAVAGNCEAKEILRSHGFQRPIAVIPQLGIDPNLFTPAEPGRNVTVIGYLGRIEPEKGVTDLGKAIESLSGIGAIKVLLVGSGSALPELTKQLTRSNVSFEAIPAVRNEKIPQLLQKLDILVLPSRTSAHWKEQFGHILIEAMSCGVVVVGSDSGEIPNVIGDAAIVFQEGNIVALRSALEAAIRSSGLRKILAQRARSRAKAHFTHDEISRRQIEFYAEIMSSTPAITELAALKRLPLNR